MRRGAAPGHCRERVVALDPRGSNALLDSVRDGILQVEEPILVDKDDESCATFAVWRAGATLGSDAEAVAGADDMRSSVGAVIRHGGGGGSGTVSDAKPSPATSSGARAGARRGHGG